VSANNPKLFNVGELSIGAESTYNTASGSLHHVRCVSADVSGLEIAALENEHLRQADYSVASIIGPKLGTITTVHQIAGWTTNTDPGAPSIANPPASGVDMLYSILASAIGNIKVGGKATDIATGGGTAPTSDTCQGTVTSFAIGQAVCYNSSTGHQISWIKNGAAGVLTFLQGRDSNQFNVDADLHGSYTIYKATGQAYHDNNNAVEGYTLQLLGHETDDKIVATGCLPTGLTMSFPIGEIPTMTITWGVGAFDESGSGAGFAGFSNGAAPATWDGALPEAVMNGWVTRGTSMGASNALRIGSLEIDMQIERPAIQDASASNGVSGYGPLRCKPKISFNVFRSESAEIDKFLEQTGEIYTFRFGSNPGSMVGICVPNGRIGAYPAKTESDGAVTSDIELYCNHYDGDTGSSPNDQNNAIDSDFRIAFC